MMSEIDAYVLKVLYELRDPLFAQIVIYFTELGSKVIVGGGVALVGLYFLSQKKFALLTGLATTMLGTSIVVFVAKELIARPRPEVVYQAYIETGYSLPSGHASLSLAFYGFVLYMLIKKFPQRKNLLFFGISSLIALIGISRLYLGVHYVSDVLAGYAVAALFLTLGIYLTNHFTNGALSSRSPSAQ